MSRRFWITLAAVIFVFVVVFPFSSGGQQHINDWRGMRHVPALKTLLAEDARFAQLSFAPRMVSEGGLLIQGEVPDTQAVATLKALVEQSQPPAPVAYNLKVSAPGEGARDESK